MSLSHIQDRMDQQDPYQSEREQLAAAFRWTARLDMHEAIANHFSLAVNEEGTQFLVNPCGMHFSRIKASDLLLVDANDPTTMEQENAPDPTAWYIHGAMHRNVPQARCILHVHSKYATALSCLKDPVLPAIDQTTARFHNRVAVDTGFDGMGFEEEGERLTTTLGNHAVLLMGNHGVMTVGPTVADAFDELYHFERGCQHYFTALQTGKELSVLSNDVAEKTAQQWENYPADMRTKHLDELMAILDEEGANFRD